MMRPGVTDERTDREERLRRERGGGMEVEVEVKERGAKNAIPAS
jgi:hypothetical protein